MVKRNKFKEFGMVFIGSILSYAFVWFANYMVTNVNINIDNIFKEIMVIAYTLTIPCILALASIIFTIIKILEYFEIFKSS